MNTYRALIVDAFTDEPLAGNAVGVVPDAEGLTDDQMRSIARELATGETTFVTESGKGDRRLRFFTPTAEIGWCERATIAAHASLFESGMVDAGTHTVETSSGVRDVAIDPDGTVWVPQPEPTVESVECEYARLAGALGLEFEALDGMADDLPLAAISTRVPYLVVPVTFLEPLADAEPDPLALERLCADFAVDGIYAFTFDAIDAMATLHGRSWTPLTGATEDLATGTVSAAAAAYLQAYDAFDSMPDELVFEQGHFADNPGIVRVRVGNGIQVGGRTTTTLDGRLLVPDDADEDIIQT